MYISEISVSSGYIMQLPLQPALHKQCGFAAFVALQSWVLLQWQNMKGFILLQPSIEMRTRRLFLSQAVEEAEID